MLYLYDIAPSIETDSGYLCIWDCNHCIDFVLGYFEGDDDKKIMM
jgi:hypothetical protein